MNSMMKFDINLVKNLLLKIAQERSVDSVLEMVVGELCKDDAIAMARIWLKKPGDECASCLTAGECLDKSKCLHLVASAGRSIVEPGREWSRIDGAFRRFPIGIRKVGVIASVGEATIVPDINENSFWMADVDWARRERITSFGGQPLMYRGEVLGVLAIFTRVRLSSDTVSLLRMLADHAATSLTNARAFEEIEHLKKRLELENSYLKEEVSEEKAFGDLIGKSKCMSEIQERINTVAPTDATILIMGESGTGKELVACEIHRRSPRAEKPMIRVNCPSIPQSLYESEFFGHVKGAFTNADKDREGRFEAADGGTLFLDEVAEIPLKLQSKLLRVIQEKEYERIGEARPRKVNVRIVTASNRVLEKEVRAGRFRQDLYYRLNVFPIELPPLRERKEDIPLLAEWFLKIAARKMSKLDLHLSPANIRQLQSYDWPGNVRELKNTIERSVIISKSDTLELDQTLTVSSGTGSPLIGQYVQKIKQGNFLTEEEMKQLVMQNTLAALKHCNWRIYGPNGAAKMLKIRPTTLASRAKALGLIKDRPQSLL